MGPFRPPAFARIRADCGTVDRDLEEALGAGPRERELLLRRLLQ